MKLELNTDARRQIEDVIKARQCPTLYETTDCDGCPLVIFENYRKSCAEIAAEFLQLLEAQNDR